MNSDYKVGTWLIHKQTGELFEVTEYLDSGYHTGPDRCVCIRRIPITSKYTNAVYNEGINVIRYYFDLAPMARILYTKEVTGAHNE